MPTSRAADRFAATPAAADALESIVPRCRATYQITGTRSNGYRETVELTADSPGQAEARANPMGLTVTSLRETSAGGILPRAPWSPARAIGILVIAAVLIVVAALIAGPALAVVGEQRRTHAKLKQSYHDSLAGYNFSTSTVYSPTPTSDGWVMVPHTVTSGGGSAFRGRDKLKADLTPPPRSFTSPTSSPAPRCSPCSAPPSASPPSAAATAPATGRAGRGSVCPNRHTERSDPNPPAERPGFSRERFPIFPNRYAPRSADSDGGLSI